MTAQTLFDLTRRYDETDDTREKVGIGDQMELLLGDRAPEFSERFNRLVEAEPEHRTPAATTLREIGPVLWRHLVEACAIAAYEANRAYCEALGDFSQVSWGKAAEWQRKSARRRVDVALSGATPEAQHAAWVHDKVADGWTRGETKDPERRTHPCLVAYAQLPEDQRQKDALYQQVVRAMAHALGVEVRHYTIK